MADIKTLENKLKTATGKLRIDVLNELASMPSETSAVAAIGYAEEALKLAQDMRDRPAEMLALENLSMAALYAGEYSKALAAAETLKEMCEQAADKRALAVAFDLIGGTHGKLGNVGSAFDCIMRSLALAKEISDQKLTATALQHVLCHDLSNPLAAILSAYKFIENDPAKIEIMGEIILQSANNGLEIIDLVRKIQALEADKLDLNLELINLKGAIADSAKMLDQRFKKKNVSVTVEIDDSLDVLAEKTSFVNSVLDNIFTNAIKFSFRGGEIIARAEKADDTVALSIRDFGIGMPLGLVDEVFDVKKATSREGTDGESGTGFGMPLVKKFVNAYNGTIAIESKEKTATAHKYGTEIKLSLKSSLA